MTKENPTGPDPSKVSSSEEDAGFSVPKSNNTNLNKLIFQAAHKVAENQAKKVVNKVQAPVKIDLGIEKKLDVNTDSNHHSPQQHKHNLSVGNISMIENYTVKFIKAFALLAVGLLVLAVISNKNLRDSVSKHFADARKILDRGEKKDLNLVKAISETYKSSALNKNPSSSQPMPLSTETSEELKLSAKVPHVMNSLSSIDTDLASLLQRFEENPDAFRTPLYQKLQSQIDQSIPLKEIIEILLHALSIRDWSIKSSLDNYLKKFPLQEKENKILNAFLKTLEIAQISGPSQNQKIMNEIETSINAVLQESTVTVLWLKKFLLLRTVFGFYSNSSLYEIDRNSLLQANHVILLSKKILFFLDILKPNFGANLEKYLSLPEYLAMIEKDFSMLKFVTFIALRTKNKQALGVTSSLAKKLITMNTLSISHRVKLNAWVDAIDLMQPEHSFNADSWDRVLGETNSDRSGFPEVEILACNSILKNKFKSGLFFGKKFRDSLISDSSKNVIAILRMMLIHIYFGELAKAKLLSDSLKPWLSHNYVFTWNQMLGFYAAARGDSLIAALKSTENFLLSNPNSPFVNLVKYYSLVELRRSAQAEQQLEIIVKNNFEFTNLSLTENLSSPYSIAHLF